ncbi:unnamed protein product [Ambrosiozyma monospora]|uniref:Unnamed protein product n=1 Tax=Ambrosiozyma monospora TaxID=43982 RepID=A0ACB5T8F6_AMBMO|nr:unnamed protein product [Ambrosiozyma monospora]
MNSSQISLYPEEGEINHYSAFSKLLGPILQSTKTRELHLRFSQGWYDAETYGKLVNDGDTSGGTGVELWALIESGSRDDAYGNWFKLFNSLSGLFCASLNFIDSSSTTYPVTLFQPKSSLLQTNLLQNDTYLLRSSLPGEPVCTENLTPFLKLLPTKGKAGISSLLTGNKVFNSQWSSMSIDILTECEGEGESTKCYYNMKQSINLILNLPKTLERNKMPIPKPTPGSELRCDMSKHYDLYHCFPLPEPTEWNYNLHDLFGKEIEGGALISSEPSKVCADVNSNTWKSDVYYKGKQASSIDSENCVDLTGSHGYNIVFDTSNSKEIVPVETPPIYASRSLSGYSQDRGYFRLDLLNPASKPSRIVIFESLPWFMRIYLHTITISSINETTSTTYKITENENAGDIIDEIIYDPSIDRVSPSHLELLVTIPASTKLKISFEFDKAMLLYAEYPPDANHGFEIPPSVIALLDDEDDQKVIYEMRTTTSLLTLPTPDFSMPYNVIILSSTVMSLAFGSIFNLLIKRTVTEEEAEYYANASLLTVVKSKIGAKVQAIKSLLKKGKKVEEKEE